LDEKEDKEFINITFFMELKKYQGVFGALMNAKISADLFNARSREYDSGIFGIFK